ncbi:hypothetical protein CLOM_g18565 [Closterium sp. NIES-68]|nr:hypothetical protein CLOM_g18565 [Closterium sp. NIES-68]GJP82255.1 hypothetical protein CLOP_g12490 [Closterium sp. NIES-67]
MASSGGRSGPAHTASTPPRPSPPRASPLPPSPPRYTPASAQPAFESSHKPSPPRFPSASAEPVNPPLLSTFRVSSACCNSNANANGNGNGGGYSYSSRSGSASPCHPSMRPSSSPHSSPCHPASALSMARVVRSSNAEEVKSAGNEYYKAGRFSDALQLYDRAVALAPTRAHYRANRAAALSALNRVADAVAECQEAVRLDGTYARGRQRLSGLYVRLGRLEDARAQLAGLAEGEAGEERGRVERVEGSVGRCEQGVKAGDWQGALVEADDALRGGADFAPQVWLWRARSCRHLARLSEAEAALTSARGALTALRLSVAGEVGAGKAQAVRAVEGEIVEEDVRLEMLLGRFDPAVAKAQQGLKAFPEHPDLLALLSRAQQLAAARTRGNELFKAGDAAGAAEAYSRGIAADAGNPVLLCNRAACRMKQGRWHDALRDCDGALAANPGYCKALLRRAACHTQLQQWDAAHRDYQHLHKLMPNDADVAKALADVAARLQKAGTLGGSGADGRRGGSAAGGAGRSSSSSGSGSVVLVQTDSQYRGAVTSMGLVVVAFSAAWCGPCRQAAPLYERLSTSYPAVKFLKVDIDVLPEVAAREGVQSVPTFKVWKHGARLTHLVGAQISQLEAAIRAALKSLSDGF